MLTTGSCSHAIAITWHVATKGILILHIFSSIYVINVIIWRDMCGSHVHEHTCVRVQV
jgi:hypothetical protein